MQPKCSSIFAVQVQLFTATRCLIHWFLGSRGADTQAAVLKPEVWHRWLPKILLCPSSAEDEIMADVLQGHQCGPVLSFLVESIGTKGSPAVPQSVALSLLSAALEHPDARHSLLSSEVVLARLFIAWLLQDPTHYNIVQCEFAC
jgi:hypothetical protein